MAESPVELGGMPNVLSHYKLTKALGSGAMGSVYQGIDRRDETAVAIKLLHAHLSGDEVYRKRFEREAHVGALLRSPYTVHLLDYGVENNQCFIVMEFVEGETLANAMRSGPLPLERALPIAIQVARALDEAQARNVVHRDIKPENILLRADDSVKVADFGIAREIGWGTLTTPGGFIGTFSYAAPEQFQGRADTRSDIYSLGATLYCMLAGRPPFAGSLDEMIKAICETAADMKPLAGLPRQVVDIVQRCLEKQPHRRYQSPAHLAGMLEDAYAGAVSQEPEAAGIVGALPVETGNLPPTEVFGDVTGTGASPELEARTTAANLRRQARGYLEQLQAPGSALEPPAGGPMPTAALEKQTTPESRRLLRQALDAQHRESAGQVIQLLLSAYDIDMPPDAKAELHILAGNGFFIHSEYGEAEGHFRRALRAAEEAGEKQNLGRALSNLCAVYWRRGDLDQAEEFGKRALALQRETGNRLGESKALGNLGLVYADRGDLSRAEEHHIKALAIDEEIGSTGGEEADHGNLGLVYFARGDLDKAEEHYLKALALAEQIGYLLGQGEDLHNLGDLSLRRGDLDAAETYYQRALNVNEECGHRVAMGEVFGSLGDVYAVRGDMGKAREFHERAYAVHDQLGHRLGQANQLRRLGLLEMREGNDKTARDLLQRSAQIYKAIGARGQDPETVKRALADLKSRGVKAHKSRF